MAAINLMDLDLPVGIRPPGFYRWLGFTLRGHEKQHIAVESLGQEFPHYPSIVLVRISDGLLGMLFEIRKHVPLAAQCVQHLLQRLIGYSSKKHFCFTIPVTPFLRRKRIAVEEPEQGDLLAIRLKLCGHRVSHEAAKGPADQAVRSDRLNLANKAQVVGGHVLDSSWKQIPLNKIARL